MIFCKALDKEFETKEEMFKALKANMEFIIDAKKSEQRSCDKGTAVSCRSLNGLKLLDSEKAAIDIDENFYYIVVNTTNILDSHDDLHVDGIWNKSVAEQQFKNYLVTDHELEIAHVVVKKAYVEMFVVKVSFKSLGYPYDGNTEALVYKVPKDKVINQTAKEWLESGDPIEASVRMRYITLEFAMDSNDPEDATEKSRYDKYKPKIANASDFEYIPFYYIIKEAANVRESSLVVAGSNHVTGNIMRPKQQSTKVEPEESTQVEDKNTIDPTEVSQKLKSSSLLLT